MLTVDYDTTQAVAVRDELVAETNATVATMTLDGDEARALAAADDAVAGINSLVAAIQIAANTASINATIDAYDGQIVGTAYVNIVGTGNPTFGLGLQNMLGGVIPSAANGRIVEMAEAGPEWVGTPGGRGFLAAQHGLYGVPAGSLVHTAPATRAMGLDRGGGITLNLTIAGNVYGIDNLAEEVGDMLVTALERVAPDYYRSQGVRG